MLFPLTVLNRLLQRTRVITAFVIILNCVGASGAEPFRDLFEIQVEPNFNWRPPFGLARIDGPVTVIVTYKGDYLPARGFQLESYRNGKVVQKLAIQFPKTAPLVVRKQLKSWPDEVVFRPAGSPARDGEIIRKKVEPPAFEADAIARPEKQINPVDLGMILFPENRLLLGPGQNAMVKVAAISRNRDILNGKINVWFLSNPSVIISKPFDLKQDERLASQLSIPAQQKIHDVLQITMLDANGEKFWGKVIQTHAVKSPPKLPTFGATEIKLNYDLPIAVFKKGQAGEHEKLKYEEGWDSKFNDIVVSFPNGARFVFWRGASFIPFWAGRHNTGFTYEWAESNPPEEGGYVDAVEPLMDKELRYSRVEIVESTEARVHVRWTYQSCDFNYKVWGDSMQEDFYFYPDGFGTRVLTLKSTPGLNFEVSELIVISAPEAYPLDVLPKNLIDFIFLDGEKRELKFPQKRRQATDFVNPNSLPPIYRVRIHKNEKLTPIFFSPWDRSLPYRFYMPFENAGEMVTMAYWGSHWPLSRGQNTGRRGKVNDAVRFAPAHNSIMTWGSYLRPDPIKNEMSVGVDALGEKRRMQLQVFAWLIGMTDASDDELLERAKNYGTDPPLDIHGAKSVVWNPSNRSFAIDTNKVQLKLSPRGVCVNPAFDFGKRTGKLANVKLDGNPVAQNKYAWDGKLLWLNTRLTRPTMLELKFDTK